MVTFLSGGTGTPKLLAGADAVFDPRETDVVANTGDDIELGGHLVCPDVDTVLFLEGDLLDRDTWWGIEGDTAETHDELHDLAAAAGLEEGPRYLPDARQTGGREISRWRRFAAVAEFMHIGDRDRAIHLTRTGLVDEGHTLTEATLTLAEALGVERTVLPMSDDPIASIVHTTGGPQHFQEWWVAHDGTPPVEDVEFRGATEAEPTDEVLSVLGAPVVIGPSNPVTSIGPMVAMDRFRTALESTPVVAVSPFVENQVFSGPAATLMKAVGFEPSTAGTADAYPFADAFVLDSTDSTDLDRPVVRTDTTMETDEDAERVARAVQRALAEVDR
jgi:LPPG:FO 2-phospho-L-lactate transferase